MKSNILNLPEFLLMRIVISLGHSSLSEHQFPSEAMLLPDTVHVETTRV